MNGPEGVKRETYLLSLCIAGECRVHEWIISDRISFSHSTVGVSVLVCHLKDE